MNAINRTPKITDAQARLLTKIQRRGRLSVTYGPRTVSWRSKACWTENRRTLDALIRAGLIVKVAGHSEKVTRRGISRLYITETYSAA